MNKLWVVLFVSLILGIAFLGCESADKPLGVTAPEEISAAKKAPNGGCATIQDGTIYASTGELITPGYDQYGYNYQALMFNGPYCNYDRVIGGDYCDVKLIMKWNDAWMSNKDCDGDDLLDRHYGFDSYIGSGAWLTNHQSGTNDDGTKWTYFVKIVAAPADAISEGGTWYTADGTEIGPVIWGAFAIIQQVENDPSAGIHGIQYKSPASPGFGVYKP
ncbi:hypothetical protein ACFL6H_09680 [Candidatus Latescibacterota bacterium]